MRITDLRYHARPGAPQSIEWMIVTWSPEAKCDKRQAFGTAPTHALAWAAASEAVKKILEGEK